MQPPRHSFSPPTCSLPPLQPPHRVRNVVDLGVEYVELPSDLGKAGSQSVLDDCQVPQDLVRTGGWGGIRGKGVGVQGVRGARVGGRHGWGSGFGVPQDLEKGWETMEAHSRKDSVSYLCAIVDEVHTPGHTQIHTIYNGHSGSTSPWDSTWGRVQIVMRTERALTHTRHHGLTGGAEQRSRAQHLVERGGRARGQGAVPG